MEINCPHTSGVVCSERQKPCERCGWHPDETQRRLVMIRDGKMKKTAWGKSRLKISKKIG